MSPTPPTRRGLNRRELLEAAGLSAAAVLAGLRLPVPAAAAAPGLLKILDVGPGGVIHPGSAQDYRYHDNPLFYADTRTPWIRMWADWPSLQPDGLHAPGDPAGPGYWRLLALDEQISLANAGGVRVMLMPYRFPPWANGTAALAAERNSDAEISFEFWDRMTSEEWARYRRAGRDPAAHNPSRRALEYRLPDGDPYGPHSDWAGFFAFLYERYHYGSRASGPYVHGFELVNEPNLQLWPQRGEPDPTADPFAATPATITGRIARLLATAQGISARYGHSTMLYAPSLSDGDPEASRIATRHDEFVDGLLDAFEAAGYRPHAGQGWSHHNYGDVEHRRSDTVLQRVRAQIAGRWSGLEAGQAPTVFVTEGGARLSRMASLYPAEDPRQAQAKCLRDAWALHAADTGAGAGVAMFAQYLLYSDPNFDTGLLDPYPSKVRRPAYDAWKAF